MAVTRERLTARLFLERSGTAIAVTTDDQEILRFVREPSDAVASYLTLPNAKLVPITRSPASVVTTLSDAAAARRCDPAAWATRVARRLSLLWDVPHAASSSPSRALGAVVLAATHPALRWAVASGLDPLPDVPPWASPALRAAQVDDVSAALFDRRPSRRVVAALARLLTHPLDERLAWWPLAAGIAASRAVEPDDVASILSLRLFVEQTPTIDQLRDLERLFGLFDRTEVLRIVREGLADGAAVLALVDVAARAHDVARVPRVDRPRRLEDLVRFGRSFTHGAVGQQVALAPPDARPAAPHRPTPPQWRTARSAPAVSARATDAFDRLRAALDGRSVGDLVFEAPRTSGELRTWAGLLENCLASFDDAIRQRRSLVIGVRRDGMLEAAFEIDPSTSSLRQFHGPRNRSPSRRTTTAVLRVLQEEGVRVS